MAVICQKCREPLRNGFYCGCGVNEEAIRSFGSKAGKGMAVPSSSDEVIGVSPGESGVTAESHSETTNPQANQTGVELTSLEDQVTDLKNDIKRIEGEIDALFKQRKPTSSLEWYFFAVDKFNNYNDADVWSKSSLVVHIVAWPFYGFCGIPNHYLLWLARNFRQTIWDKPSVQQENRKINDQIKAHRNKRTALLDSLNGLKTRLKELAGTNYVPTFDDDPISVVTTAVGGATSRTTAKGKELIKGFIDAIPVGTCPKCSQNWAKEADGEHVDKSHFLPGRTIDEEKGFEKEVVFVTKVEFYQEKYKCKKCSHRWQIPKRREITLREACPKCFGERSRRLVRIDDLGHEHSVRTIEKRVDHYDQDHHFTGSTYQPVQVTVRTDRKLAVFECLNCEHQWSERSSRSYIP